VTAQPAARSFAHLERPGSLRMTLGFQRGVILRASIIGAGPKDLGISAAARPFARSVAQPGRRRRPFIPSVDGPWPLRTIRPPCGRSSLTASLLPSRLVSLAELAQEYILPAVGVTALECGGGVLTSTVGAPPRIHVARQRATRSAKRARTATKPAFPVARGDALVHVLTSTRRL
jgi:hypothetical protein